MKKFLIIGVLALALAGCGDAYAKITDGKDAIVSVGNQSVTRGQLFELMMNQDPASTVITMAKQVIMDEKIEVNDAIRASAAESLEEIKESFGEEFADYIKRFGYKDEADYVEKALVPFAQQEALVKEYVTENFESIATVYFPRKIRVIQTKTEEDAKAAINEVKDGGNFETVAAKYSSSTAYKGELKLVHSESGYPEVVTTFLKTALQPTLTAEPLKDATTSLFYVVQVVESQPTRYQDEAIEELVGLSSVAEEMFVELFKEGGFKVYDKIIFDILTSDYSQYLP
jgi:foldase protein PrsA